MYYYGWRPYVPVETRRANATREVKKLVKKGLEVKPVHIEGRKIATTFWGKAWCDHLESFSDFENRLPRGRTYVRNGSVCHLEIKPGEISAMVAGYEMYKVRIHVEKLAKDTWQRIQSRCRGKIGSLLDLLQGKISSGIMDVVIDRKNGLFPLPKEIKMACSCPDWAVMCKHVAASLYGVGARLDESPELLFLLRGVDHQELITAGADLSRVTSGKGGGRRLKGDELADVFGVDVIPEAPSEKKRSKKPAAKEPVSGRKSTKGTTARQKVAKETSTKAAATPRKRTAKKPKPAASPAVPVAKPVARRKKTAKRTTKVLAFPAELPKTGNEIRALRESRGMNQTAFARFLGVSPMSVKNWETKADEELRLMPKTRKALRKAIA